jgi:hypothetical protein
MGGMNKETLDLVAQLCVRIGMIMEDATPVALSSASAATARAMDKMILELERSSEQISALVKAARLLL